MQVGNVTDPLPEEITALGFECVDKVTILGLEIGNKADDFSNSFNKIAIKIRGIISNWARFNLSLPGRIAIAKCMLYSQLNYLGCFLDIPELKKIEISNIIESFVSGPLKLSKNRLYLLAFHSGCNLL
jgi:hypothetical protein